MPYSHLKGAVISSEAIAAHEQNMLAQAVDVRDGDDAIVVQEEDEVIVNETREEEDDGRITVNLNTETGEVDGEDNAEGSEEESNKSEAEANGVDFSGADLTSIDEVGKLLTEADAGKAELMAEAIEKGLDPALTAVLEAEIIENGKPSPESYEALAAVGYTKAFVDAFLAGQQANAEKYVAAIHGFAGGKDNFDKLCGFLGNNHASLADAFNAAVERNDVATMKAILETGKGLYSKHVGKAPARNVANLAKPNPVAQQGAEIVGFKSRDEMVKAMSDVRYQKDAAYRREVEMRVLKATF